MRGSTLSLLARPIDVISADDNCHFVEGSHAIRPRRNMAAASVQDVAGNTKKLLNGVVNIARTVICPSRSERSS